MDTVRDPIQHEQSQATFKSKFQKMPLALNIMYYFGSVFILFIAQLCSSSCSWTEQEQRQCPAVLLRGAWESSSAAELQVSDTNAVIFQ